MKIANGVCTIAIVALMGYFSAQAWADSIALRDGRLIRGKFAGGTQGVIAFTVDGATEYYDVTNIVMMTFGEDGADTQTGSTHPNALHKDLPFSSVVPQRKSSKFSTPSARLTQTVRVKHPKRAQKRIG